MSELVNKYYSIGEVAEILGESKSKIRYWEKIFNQYVKPRRSRRGDRMFSVKDIENLKLIQHLVDDLGFTLEGAKVFLKHRKKELEAKLQIVSILKNVRKEMEELRNSIE